MILLLPDLIKCKETHISLSIFHWINATLLWFNKLFFQCTSPQRSLCEKWKITRKKCERSHFFVDYFWLRIIAVLLHILDTLCLTGYLVLWIPHGRLCRSFLAVGTLGIYQDVDCVQQSQSLLALSEGIPIGNL